MRVAKKSVSQLKVQSEVRPCLRVGLWATTFVLLSLSVMLDSHAQKENRISYNILATTLSDALFQVATQSDLQLIVQQTELHGAKVDIKLSGMFSLQGILKKVLKQHEFEYELINNSTIIVRSISGLDDEPYLKDLNEAKIVNQAVDEIIVSARKRKQNIMTVPQHVATISEQKINRKGIQRVEDISKQVLSMTFSQKRGYDQSSLRIRGIGTQVLGAGVEPSVSTVVDGVVMARGGAQFNDLADVERIEVLNGPQGILYGKNASAGLVNIITKRPNDEHNEARVRAYITSDKDVGAKFSVSGPINEQFSYRLSGARRKWDGNANNITTGNLVNGVDTGYVSGKINWSVNERINTLLSADYSNQKTECCARITRDDRLGIFVDPSFVGDPTEGGSVESILGFVASDDSNTIAQNRDPVQNSINLGVSLEIVAELENHMLSSLTAARNWQSENSWDNDLLPIDFHENQVSDRDSNWFTHEIRLASQANRQIEYLVGLYFFYSKIDTRELADRTYINAPIDEIIRVDSEIVNQNSSIFGNIDWHANDQLTLFAGFRLLHDKVSARAFRGGQDLGFDGELIVDFTTPVIENEASESALISKVGVQYHLSNSVNLYAFGTTGYKGRSFGVEFGFDPSTFKNGEPVSSERSKSWELGLKGSFLNSKLNLALNGYYTVIDNLQIGQRDLTTIANVLGTAPETVTKGVEVTFDSMPSNNFSIAGGVAFNQAFFSDFNNGLCYLGQSESDGCVNGAQSLTGQSLENAPKWKVLLNTRYQWPLNWQDFYASVHGTYRWQSRAYLSDDGDPGGLQGAFSLVDFGIELGSTHGRWKASVNVNNAFDRHYAAGISANSADGGGVIVHTIPRDFGRYIGLSFTVDL